MAIIKKGTYLLNDTLTAIGFWDTYLLHNMYFVDANGTKTSLSGLVQTYMDSKYLGIVDAAGDTHYIYNFDTNTYMVDYPCGFYLPEDAESERWYTWFTENTKRLIKAGIYKFKNTPDIPDGTSLAITFTDVSGSVAKFSIKGNNNMTGMTVMSGTEEGQSYALIQYFTGLDLYGNAYIHANPAVEGVTDGWIYPCQTIMFVEDAYANVDAAEWLFASTESTTDLTGTTWYVPSGYAISAGYGKFSITYDCIYEGATYSLLETLWIGYNGGTAANNYLTMHRDGSIVKYISSNAHGIRFVFTGGTDATNPSLIAWLFETGELKNTSIEIIYKDKVVTLKAGQTATLSCLNKTMIDDVIVSPKSDAFPSRIFYGEKLIAYVSSGSKARLVCKGMTMAHDVKVAVDSVNSSVGLQYLSNKDGTCTVRGLGTCTDTDIVIPDRSPSGERVTAIGENAFYDNDTITGVHIPNSVITIEEDAFGYCVSLASVTFEENSQLETMGMYAFYNCSSLESIIMPDNVTSIGRFAFSWCSALKNIHLPKSLLEIDREWFEHCSSIETITVASDNPNYHGAGNCVIETATGTLELGCKNSVIPTEGVTKIGNSAFRESGITSVVIPASVTLLDWYAFENCKSLTSVTFSENSLLEVIEYDAFGYCSNLTSIVLPDSLKKIGDYVFRNCTNLTSVSLPSGLTEIGRYAFYVCPNLKNMSIPDSVTAIDQGAFNGCDSLVQAANGISYVDKWAVACATTVTSVQIRAGTVGIIASFCNGSEYSAITSVSLPSGLKYICGFAFCDCSGLTSMNIPDSVIKIGMNAFDTSAKIVSQDPLNAFYVGKWLVDCDYAATSVSIRAGTVGIADYALSLQYVGYDSPLEEVTIPEGLKYIGIAGLRDARFTSITLPSSIVDIAHNALVECDLLTTINVPWGSSDTRNADAPWGAPNATVNYNYSG